MTDFNLRVPATVWPIGYKGGGYIAKINRPDATIDHPGYPIQGNGDTAAAAKADLSTRLMAALATVGEIPILVIGGAEQYAGHVHLVMTTAYGTETWYARTDGTGTGCHGACDRTLEEELAGVLRHVGGTPTVVRFR